MFLPGMPTNVANSVNLEPSLEIYLEFNTQNFVLCWVELYVRDVWKLAIFFSVFTDLDYEKVLVTYKNTDSGKHWSLESNPKVHLCQLQAQICKQSLSFGMFCFLGQFSISATVCVHHYLVSLGFVSFWSLL